MKKIKVLIVDDIFPNQLLLSTAIESLGHSYTCATNGKKAIEALEREHYDIVFMDIEMPVMNGIETTAYIRKNMPEQRNSIPIIALTAHNPADYAEEFNKAGFSSLMTKPYSIEKIMDIITQFSSEH